MWLAFVRPFPDQHELREFLRTPILGTAPSTRSSLPCTGIDFSPDQIQRRSGVAALLKADSRWTARTGVNGQECTRGGFYGTRTVIQSATDLQSLSSTAANPNHGVNQDSVNRVWGQMCLATANRDIIGQSLNKGTIASITRNLVLWEAARTESSRMKLCILLTSTIHKDSRH